MLKTAAIVFGVALVLAGILGFVPGVTNDGMLLGIFHVNTAHNLVHLISGAVALWAGFTSTAHSRTYFRVFGIIYAVVAALGFFVRDGQHAGHAEANRADVRIWERAKFIGATAPHLRFGFQLNVRFKANYRFVFHNVRQLSTEDCVPASFAMAR